MSACNPACPEDQICTHELRCVDPGDEEQRVAEERKKSHLAELANRSSGLHWGVLLNEEIGAVNGNMVLATRPAAVANYRLGRFDLRGSVGPLWVWDVQYHGQENGALMALDVAVDALVRLTSRYGLGLGLRLGLGSTTLLTGLYGLTLWPAVFSLGHDRNVELGISASVKGYSDQYCYSGNGRTDCTQHSLLNVGAGVAVSYLWY